MLELRFIKDQPISVCSDNKGCIDLAKNSKFSPRTKHIKIRHFFIKHHIQLGEVKIVHVPAAQQFADQLTKAVPADALRRFTRFVGLINEKGGCSKGVKQNDQNNDKKKNLQKKMNI